jgi:spore coat assembly protein
LPDYSIGDFVARKSYGKDVVFVISDIVEDVERSIEEGERRERYVLKGLTVRLVADADKDDLVKINPKVAKLSAERNIYGLKRQRFFNQLYKSINLFNIGHVRRRGIPGKVLHIDGSREFLNSSMAYYKILGLNPVGVYVDEPEQPNLARSLLSKYNPDIVVFTGHDGLRKDATDIESFGSYTYSRYYYQAVSEARAYQPDPEGLFVYAGACQSYYEALISAGATYASSPARVLIHSTDPVTLASRIALTPHNRIITPKQAVMGTYSGTKGIGGVDTRGRLKLI